MTANENDYVVSDLEYNVITTLATLLQSEDVLEQYRTDARDAGESEIEALFTQLKHSNREIATGLRKVLRRNLSNEFRDAL